MIDETNTAEARQAIKARSRLLIGGEQQKGRSGKRQHAMQINSTFRHCVRRCRQGPRQDPSRLSLLAPRLGAILTGLSGSAATQEGNVEQYAARNG
jgi:hypothetical protein